MTTKNTKSKEATEISVIDAEVHGQQAITPMSLIERAQNDASTSIEKMEQLFELQLRWEQNEAKKAYFDAFAAFKSEAIQILKDKKVKFQAGNGTTEYNHATIGNVVGIITPFLGKHGLSHRWDVTQEGNGITVSCVLSHKLGHSERVSMTASKDDSGKKNLIQQVASTVTYLQRYTLLAITGLATKDQPDDDGHGSEDENVDYITENQEADLLALLSEVKETEQRLCTYYKIDSVAHLPADKFADAVSILERKRK